MKERLIQLLDLEQLTPSKFADIIGVQRSSVSHVISERNKPSFDFIQKTLKAFPGLNAEWLILGEGSMYEQMGRGVSGNLFGSAVDPVQASFDGDIKKETQEEVEKMDSELTYPSHSAPQSEDRTQETSEKMTADREREPAENESNVKIQELSKEKKVVQVMVFYEDDTFRSFKPSQ